MPGFLANKTPLKAFLPVSALATLTKLSIYGFSLTLASNESKNSISNPIS